VSTFHYLSPEEYDALGVEQKAAYIDAALDHLAAQAPEATLSGKGPHPPDPDAVEVARTRPPPHQAPQQQQQQQQPPPAHDAEPLAPSENQSNPSNPKAK
jgi:hypothetical protein